MARCVVFLLSLWGAESLPLSAAVSTERPSRVIPSDQNLYHADLLRVIDGDTLEVRIHLLPGLTQITHIRVRDVDMPELRAPCPEQRHQAEAARDYLMKLFPEGSVLRLTGLRPDKYGGRYDAHVMLPDGSTLAEHLRGKFVKGRCG